MSPCDCDLGAVRRFTHPAIVVTDVTFPATGGTGQASTAAMARRSSPSSTVTWPSAVMQAATPAITARLTFGLAWANSASARSKFCKVHCSAGTRTACPSKFCAGLKCPLDVRRLLLPDVGQRREDDGRRLGNRIDRPIADRRRLSEPEGDVQVAEQHRAETVFEQVNPAVRAHQGIDHLAELRVLLRRGPLDRRDRERHQRQPGRGRQSLGRGQQVAASPGTTAVRSVLGAFAVAGFWSPRRPGSARARR